MSNWFFEQVIPWPTPAAELNPDDVFRPYAEAINAIRHGAAATEDTLLLETSKFLFQNEVARQASISGRGAGMMAAISIAAALVTGVGFTAFRDARALSNAAFWAIFATFAVALCYLAWTTVLAFQVQGSRKRNTPDPSDLVALPQGARIVAAQVLQYTVANYKVNNQAANEAAMGEACFRNAILVLVVGGLVTAVIQLQPSPGADSGRGLAQALARGGGCSDLPSLTADRKGRWQGTCLHGGHGARVFVDTDGRVSFPTSGQ